MKLYKTLARDPLCGRCIEFASSAGDASKARTRLKKAGLVDIKTEEVEVETTRVGLISFLNKMLAHESWAADALAKK